MKNLLVLPVFLFSFSTSIFSQGEFTWDQSKKCRVFTSFNIPKGTFTHSGGVCKDGYLNGKASVRLFDNNVLWASITGTFEAGYLTGKGEILWERGDKFSGDFVKGKRTYGVFTYKSGLIYTGSFNGNAMTGQGKLIDPNGDIYEGSFKNGYFEGAGTFNYANGNKFSGHYIKHMREGKGTIWYANGNRYEGDFHVGLCDIGTMYYKNGGSAQGSVDYEDVFTKFVIEMNDDFVNEKPKEQKVEQGKFNSPTNALEYLRSNLQEAYTPDFQYAIVFDFSLDKVVLRYHSYYKDQHAKGSTVRIEKSFLWRDTEFHYSVGPQGDESIVEFLEIKNSNGNEKVTCRKRNPYIKAIYDIIDAVEYLKSH